MSAEESGCTNAVVDGGGGKDGCTSDDEVYAAICDDGEEYIDKVINILASNQGDLQGPHLWIQGS